MPPAPGSRTETVWPTVEPRQPSEGRGSHHWLFGLLIGAALVIVALTALVLRTNRAREQAQPPATATENPAASPGAAAANPALRDVELAGFRIIEDAKQKPELRFVIVNHSGADLGDVKAKVDLRAATNDQGAEPVASFTFAVKLGPYESKELKVALATKLRAYELPDWQRLRADISGQ